VVPAHDDVVGDILGLIGSFFTDGWVSSSTIQSVLGLNSPSDTSLSYCDISACTPPSGSSATKLDASPVVVSMIALGIVVALGIIVALFFVHNRKQARRVESNMAVTENPIYARLGESLLGEDNE
jgi:hypothetical protein